MTCDIDGHGQFNMPATEQTHIGNSDIFCVTMNTEIIPETIALPGACLQCIFAVNNNTDSTIQVAFGQAAFTFPGKYSLSQTG